MKVMKLKAFLLIWAYVSVVFLAIGLSVLFSAIPIGVYLQTGTFRLFAGWDFNLRFLGMLFVSSFLTSLFLWLLAEFDLWKIKSRD
ncbi:MAG: hypothetical protein ACK5PF_03115 [bacterium]|jgi:hypothetical protein